jgi:hypothetical protein
MKHIRIILMFIQKSFCIDKEILIKKKKHSVNEKMDKKKTKKKILKIIKYI